MGFFLVFFLVFGFAVGLLCVFFLPMRGKKVVVSAGFRQPLCLRHGDASMDAAHCFADTAVYLILHSAQRSAG